MKNITIGADPEFFLLLNDNPLSSEGLIGGSKYKPLQIDNGCAVLEDNVMVEFNTPPTTSVDQMQSSIAYVKDYVKNNVSQIIGEDVSISDQCSMVFDEKQLSTRQAREFGCEPDLNIWDKKKNDTPNKNMNIRFAGGHVHVGFESDDMLEDGFELVKLLDFSLGVPSILFDKDEERRKIYGRAGNFRIKKYGIEYRTLSNFWIFDESRVEYVYMAVNRAVKLFNEGFVVPDIRHIIDNSDYDKAVELSNKYNLL